MRHQTTLRALAGAMSLTHLLAGLGLCGTLFAAGAAMSAEEEAPPAEAPQQIVDITGTNDPEMRSYRSVAKAFDAFDEHRQLAPAAVLRFRFAHKGGAPVTEADGLTLKLMIGDTPIPIPVDPDGRFTITRNQAAYDADATFVLNRKKGLFVYRPDVRTPGLPENVRRLGDLRLECYVLSAVAKDELPFLVRAFFTAKWRTSDWCGKKNISISYPAYGQLARVTLSDGKGRGYQYFDSTRYSVPIGGKFSDDALIELQYVPNDAASQKAKPDTVP